MQQHSLAGNRLLKKDALTRVQSVVLPFREGKLGGVPLLRVIPPHLTLQPLQFSADLFAPGLKSDASSVL